MNRNVIATALVSTTRPPWSSGYDNRRVSERSRVRVPVEVEFFHSWSDSSTVTFQLFIHCIIPLAVSGFFHMPKTYLYT